MRRIIILTISTGFLIISSILGGEIYKSKDNSPITNEISQMESTDEINTVSDNEDLENTEVTEDKTSVEENISTEIQEESTLANVENAKSEKTANDKSNETINKSTTSTSTKSSSSSEKNTTTSSSNNNHTTTTQTPTEESSSTSNTKQESKYWCVDGGIHHISGDGVNEHGYYNTWDEAFKAYEEYTKGWESTQFKVDQCDCGLYYFWAIK